MWCTAVGSCQSGSSRRRSSDCVLAIHDWVDAPGPVLIGGPPLTVFWIAVMYLTVLN